jgi:alpha-tubulin suppressor-like RCC1 family protein
MAQHQPHKNLTDVQAVAEGRGFVVAVKSNGTVCSWGQNPGSNKNGAPTNSSTPQVVPGLTNMQAVAAGDAFVLEMKKTAARGVGALIRMAS